MKNKGLVLGFIVIVSLLGTYLYIYNPEPVHYGEDPEDQVVCTQDALLCPDGSYVGRVAPDCQFAACPIPEGAQMEDGTIE